MFGGRYYAQCADLINELNTLHARFCTVVAHWRPGIAPLIDGQERCGVEQQQGYVWLNACRVE